MKDYRRLKYDENSRLSLSWNLNREISKLNYRVHTDAIQQNLLPPELTREQQSYVYADEADMLNVAHFGMTTAFGDASIADAESDSRRFYTPNNKIKCI